MIKMRLQLVCCTLVWELGCLGISESWKGGVSGVGYGRTENGGQKRGMDRNGGIRTEMGYGEKRRIAERNGDAGNSSEGREC